VRVADPAFVGRHVEADAEVSSKVVFKDRPEEKVGILAEIDGRCGIIEYSDLPADMASERDAAGELKYRAGNPAIHLFSVAFLEKVTSGDTRLAYHVARKKVPHFDPATGRPVTPVKENALKFEMFVFDALPLAERWLAVSVRREDEFAPLKNATGADSPETCRRLQIARAARWLEAAGATVPRGADGDPAFPVEVSPLFALDETECAGKIPPGTTITGPTVFG
jgi:UDP-N-acetylglucosamine/UDP-N-acetylgalactosamine diphosphorylase